MTLSIELSEEQKSAIAERARTQGISLEQYARQVLEHDLESPAPRRRHISEVIRENMCDVPADVMATMPKDGASQHDHYIYGLPKKQP